MTEEMSLSDDYVIGPIPHSSTWGGSSKTQIFLATKLDSIHSIPCSGSVARRHPEIRMVLNLGIPPGCIWKTGVPMGKLGWRGISELCSP